MMHGQANIRYEIYLLIKYIKSVRWRVAKRLSYIEDARCLKVKLSTTEVNKAKKTLNMTKTPNFYSIHLNSKFE